ncbi:MAG TPA: response regulator transcription factor [Candidatus Eisenbacteria bacterium]|nr:response regulator transcription factor [Candidatus Eisenbacteria bacterium]
MINVILADHQRIFRVGLATALAAEEDIRIVGQPQSISQLLRRLEIFQPHVLVLSSAFMGGIDEIRLSCDPQQTAILLLEDRHEKESPLVSGEVQGVLQRSADETTMVRSIRQLALGGKVFCLVRKTTPEADLDPVGYRVRQRMTPHELRIIGFVVQGFRNREIAARTGTTEHAIKQSMRRIFDKTGVFDRLELALYVVHHRALREATRELRPLPELREAAVVRPAWEAPRRTSVN